MDQETAKLLDELIALQDFLKYNPDASEEKKALAIHGIDRRQRLLEGK